MSSLWLDAVTAGCRTIEQFLRLKGEFWTFKVSAFAKNEGSTDLESATGVVIGAPAPLRLGVQLAGEKRVDPSPYLGPGEDREGNSLSPGTASIVKEPVRANAVPNAGHRAGMDALFRKLQTGISNAIKIATAPDITALRKLVPKAVEAHSDDIVVTLLVAVIKLRDEKHVATQLSEEAKVTMEVHPEVELRKRIQLKVKAKYLETADVLEEFQVFLEKRHSKPHTPGAVSDFLAQVEL